MRIDYTKTQLYFKHYLWSVDRREDIDTHDLDTQPLDVLQGFEVLIFANTFLNLYLPDHTITDLHNLEVALMGTEPHYMKSKKDIATYLARHIYLVRPKEVYHRSQEGYRPAFNQGFK